MCHAGHLPPALPGAPVPAQAASTTLGLSLPTVFLRPSCRMVLLCDQKGAYTQAGRAGHWAAVSGRRASAAGEVPSGACGGDHAQVRGRGPCRNGPANPQGEQPCRHSAPSISSTGNMLSGQDPLNSVQCCWACTLGDVEGLCCTGDGGSVCSGAAAPHNLIGTPTR